ncbi:HAD family hydrolase [Thiogranum longum]
MNEKKSKPAISAVVFDFGGVLADEGFRDGLRALATEQGLDVDQLPRAGMDAVYDSGFVLGTGSADDFWDLLRRRTGLVGENRELTEQLLRGFRVRPWMIEAVRRLRAAGYTTAILSDQTDWLDELDARAHFKQEFDEVYNSYYLGKGKRDPSLFDDVASDLCLDPGQILFVDDDSGNVASARERGLHAICYQDPEQFIRELKRYGLE